jgi:hypothetical protein
MEEEEEEEEEEEMILIKHLFIGEKYQTSL